MPIQLTRSNQRSNKWMQNWPWAKKSPSTQVVSALSTMHRHLLTIQNWGKTPRNTLIQGVMSRCSKATLRKRLKDLWWRLSKSEYLLVFPLTNTMRNLIITTGEISTRSRPNGSSPLSTSKDSFSDNLVCMGLSYGLITFSNSRKNLWETPVDVYTLPLVRHRRLHLHALNAHNTQTNQGDVSRLSSQR